ncbi:unnamed protein product [Sphagnum jensenii]|uniref:Uncharacterized protein n=1 Tax=Sphagnum jensenii TaxID=128206 RepID=A0ABP0VDB3_9BRYO
MVHPSSAAPFSSYATPCRILPASSSSGMCMTVRLIVRMWDTSAVFLRTNRFIQNYGRGSSSTKLPWSSVAARLSRYNNEHHRCTSLEEYYSDTAVKILSSRRGLGAASMRSTVGLCVCRSCDFLPKQIVIGPWKPLFELRLEELVVTVA